SVKLLVGGDAAGAEAEIEAALAEVIEKRQPASHVGWVMLVEADGGRTQANAFGLSQSAGNKNLGHDDVLVFHRVMFANPELAEAQLFRPDDKLQVLIVTLGQRLG